MIRVFVVNRHERREQLSDVINVGVYPTIERARFVAETLMREETSEGVTYSICSFEIDKNPVCKQTGKSPPFVEAPPICVFSREGSSIIESVGRRGIR